MPLEMITPQRSISRVSRLRAASAMASRAATTANWIKRPIRRASVLPRSRSGSKPFTSAARRTFLSEAS